MNWVVSLDVYAHEIKWMEHLIRNTGTRAPCIRLSLCHRRWTTSLEAKTISSRYTSGMRQAHCVYLLWWCCCCHFLLIAHRKWSISNKNGFWKQHALDSRNTSQPTAKCQLGICMRLCWRTSNVDRRVYRTKTHNSPSVIQWNVNERWMGAFVVPVPSPLAPPPPPHALPTIYCYPFYLVFCYRHVTAMPNWIYWTLIIGHLWIICSAPHRQPPSINNNNNLFRRQSADDDMCVCAYTLYRQLSTSSPIQPF